MPNDTVSLGDFLAEGGTSKVEGQNNDTVTLDSFMNGESSTVEPSESIKAIPEEHKQGFLSGFGNLLLEGIGKGAASFNDLVFTVTEPMRYTNPVGFFPGFEEERNKLKETFVNEPMRAAKRFEEKRKTDNPAMQFVNDLTVDFANLGVTLPIDIMTGGATKTGLAGKALPEIEAIINRIPNFALGSGWRGLVEGMKAENPIEAPIKGASGAVENIAINTLYAKAGIGVKGISAMTALGAANATYEAVKEGRPPTQEELINGSAEGAAYGMIFTLFPLITKATKTAQEKALVTGYEKDFNDKIGNGDLEGAKKIVQDALGDTRLFSEGIYQKVFNRFQSIENTVEKAKALGFEVKPGEDAGLSATRYLSIVNQAQNTLEQGTFKVSPEGKVEVTGEGLKPILLDYEKASTEKDIKVRDQDLKDYLIAKRTVEDLQRPKGEGQENIVTEEQVKTSQDRLNAIQEKYKDSKVLEDTAKRLYDYQARVLHLLVDSGNMTEEMYKNIISKNPNYIPFDRIMPEEKAEGILSSKNRFGAKSPVKKIKGSEKEIHDPIESIIKNTYKIMDRAARNKVFQDIWKLKDIEELEMKEIKAPIVPVANIERRAAVDRDYLMQVKSFVESLGAKVITTGQPGRVLGYYHPAGKVVERKFTTPEEVISHEAGHFLDDKYKLKDKFYKRGSSKEVGEEIYKFMRDQGQSENRLKKVSERFAHAFEWWLSNRALAEKDIPLFSKKIESIISEIPELKPLLTIRPTPGLNIESMQETIFAPSQFKPKGNVIEGYIEGERKYLETSENLYQAMTGMDEVSVGLMTRILSKPAQWLRAGATITPEFMLRNPIRDQWTALLQTDLGFKPFIDSSAAIADVLGKSDLYNDWIRSGGSYSGFVELSRPKLKKMVAELKGNKSLLTKLNIVTNLQDLSQLFEQATRVGVYKAGLKKGLNAVEAAKVSRESTIDFSRRGSATKDINATIAFFNAGLQGIDKTIRVARKDPAGLTMKAITTITIPSLLLYLRNRQDPEYAELPRWQKDLFWVFKVGDTWVRIPKPFSYGQIFGSLPERFFEYIDTKDTKSFDKLAESLYNSVSPISGDPMSGLLPTAIKPLVENMTNWSFFKGRPIVSEGKQRLIPSEQSSKYDSETAKLLGKIINVSPSKIENFVQGYLGGSGRYIMQLGDKFIGTEKKNRPTELTDIPLVKGFVTADPMSGQSESVQRFYDNKNRLEALYNTYRAYLKEGKREEAIKLRNKNPDLMKARTFTNSSKSLSDIEKQIDRVVASNKDEKEKRQQIKSLEARKVILARRANEILNNR